MNATEYIIKRLQGFAETFKKAKARYEYDSLTQSHTIEISPLSIYNSDDFLEWEGKIFDEFVFLYPTETIGFISEDALVGIDSVNYAIEGINYAPYNTDPTDPIHFFDTQSVNILLSNIICHDTTLSIANNNGRDSFKTTVVTNDDLDNGYKLAA